MSAKDPKSNAGGAAGKPQSEEVGGLGAEERAQIRSRSSEIGQYLDKARGTKQVSGPNGSRQSALGQGFKMAIDLVAGVAVGFGIGWALDRAFNTRPIFMVIFIILGFVAGMMSLIKSALRMQAQVEQMQRSAPSVRDDDEEASR